MMLVVIMTTTSSMMMTAMITMIVIFMTTFPVGYTTADVVYQWTAGRGVNIASDMKLSQVWSSWSPPSSLSCCSSDHWPCPCYSQFDLISSPTGNETTHLNHGLPFSLSRWWWERWLGWWIYDDYDLRWLRRWQFGVRGNVFLSIIKDNPIRAGPMCTWEDTAKCCGFPSD